MKTIQFFSLIEELCPNGVDFEEINKVFTIVRPPRKLTRDKYKETGKYAIVDQGQSLVIGYTDEEEALVPEQDYVVFGDHTRYVKYVDFPFVQGADGLVILRSKSKAYCLKYLFYAFSNLQIPSRGYNRHWTIANKLKIPIPPLPLQEEIVRILDTFTALENELEKQLEAELAARTKQYEYYRNYLLVNHNSITTPSLLNEAHEHSLADVCLPVSNIKWNENTGKTYRYIDLTSTDRDTKSIHDTVTINSENAPSRAQQIVKVNDVIFGSTRPTLKRFAFITDKFDGEICSTGFCVLRSDPNKVLPKYLYYQISSTPFEEHVEKYQRGSAYPAITDKDLKSFKIQVPPLEVQQQIVAILDRFDTMVNDLKSGLPAEIALRRKQYEYYRDKLLTFHPLS